jgi:hypothetical protein
VLFVLRVQQAEQTQMRTPRHLAKLASKVNMLQRKAPAAMTAKLAKLTWTKMHRHHVLRASRVLSLVAVEQTVLFVQQDI